MEYACELWDGCYLLVVDKMEKLKLEAARIITVPIFTRVVFHFIPKLD